MYHFTTLRLISTWHRPYRWDHAFYVHSTAPKHGQN